MLIYTVKTLGAGLWALRQLPGFEETLAPIINAGGDTDTNGAVAGAVLGARLGSVGIPSRGRDGVRDAGGLTRLADSAMEFHARASER